MQDKPTVGWMCTYLPLEILEAGGIQPLRIIPDPSSERADSYLDPNFCPYIRTLLGESLDGKYSSLSGFVLMNTCDGMRRLYDALRFYSSPSFCYLLEVPRTTNPAATIYFRERLEEFKDKISSHFGVEITSADLRDAIEKANVTRALLRRVSSQISKADFLNIVKEGWEIPRESFNGKLEEMLKERASFSPSGPKILLSGSFVEGDFIARLVEELGGEIVFLDLCAGERILDEISLNSENPLESLSEAYLSKSPCARMWDTEKRINYLRELVEKTSPQGFIYQVMKFCDTYLYEIPALKTELKKMGIPFLLIEGEYSGRASGGVRTRVQAFLEMLESFRANPLLF